MALIYPTAKLDYYPPRRWGLASQYGFGRDWRPSARWMRWNTEFIDPIKAIAPAGLYYPVSMALSDWTIIGNGKLREVKAAGVPTVTWLNYYDGTAYALGTGSATAACGIEAPMAWDTYAPRFVLHTIRQSGPPGDNLITPQVNCDWGCLWFDGAAWQTGRICLYLPLHGSADADYQFDSPMLCQVNDTDVPPGTYWDVWTKGQVLARGPRSSSMTQGECRESWVFEFEEVWLDANGALHGALGSNYLTDYTFLGTHILIRNSGNMGEWWHYFSKNLRLLSLYDGLHPFTITMAGAVASLNWRLITYGEGAGIATMPLEAQEALPAEWATTGVYTSLASAVDNWTTATAKDTISGLMRPIVAFTRTSGAGANARPVLWASAQQHAAVIDNADATHTDTTTTDLLRSVTWTVDRTYRGATGRADFHPSLTELYPTWQENGVVEVTMGWPDAVNADMQAAKVGTGYIKPGGLKRSRSGEAQQGDPALSLELGDFFASRAPQKDCIDVRQAAGMTVTAWLSMIGNRMGLPATRITCSADVSALVIPVGELPSNPTLDPADGSDWTAHIAAVEKACSVTLAGVRRNLRVGIDVDGKLFADAGQPIWLPGDTADLVIDYDTLTEEDIIYEISHEPNPSQHRNMLKVVYGQYQTRAWGDKRSEYRWTEPLADRLTGIGDDWPKVIVDDNAREYLDAAYWFTRECYDWQSVIQWTGPSRRLLPDATIEIGDCPGIGLTVGAIYQVTRWTGTVDIVAFDANCSITAKLIYTP